MKFDTLRYRYPEQNSIQLELEQKYGIAPQYSNAAATMVLDNLLMQGVSTSRYAELTEAITGGDRGAMVRDNDGVPLFRIRYAANIIANELMPKPATEDKPKLKIIPHFDRMEAIIEALVQTQRDNLYPYNLPNAEVPNRSEKVMPSADILPRGSREHALYLWHVCYWMGGGIESNIAFSALTDLYTSNPELFRPEYVVEQGITEEQIASIVSQYPALRFNLSRVQNYWTYNASKLYEQYGSDPRQIYADDPGYRKVKKRLCNKGKQGFLGFQEKMASMYTHYLEDGKMIKPTPFPPAVDMHLLRLAISTEMITFENVPPDGNVYSQETIAMVRKVLFDYIIETCRSEVEVDDALWRFSKLMCAIAPGNASTVDRKLERNKKSSYKPPDFSDPTVRRKYARSCGACAIESMCKNSVTSGEYYADDKMIVRQRQKPEDEVDTLFAIGSSAALPAALYRKKEAKNRTPFEAPRDPLF